MSDFQVTKGSPTEEEIAAAAIVIAAALTPAPEGHENRDRPMAGGWNSYWRRVRQPFVYGPEAWRGSLR